MSEGPEEKEWRRAAAGDANLKLGRFKNCATASKDIKPHLATFFGAAAEEVRQRHDEGMLSLTAVIGSSQLPCTGHFDTGQPQCGNTITAARPDTSHSSSTMHTEGTVAFSCPHTVPLCGGFVDMYTAEQFCYYLIILRNLLTDAEVRSGLGHQLCTELPGSGVRVWGARWRSGLVTYSHTHFRGGHSTLKQRG